MQIGRYNTLTVLRFRSVGAYLGDELGNDVLLPNKYLSDDIEVGKEIEVFVYKDSEHRPVATTLTPKITLHTFAYLEVKSVDSFGAFLDWGLEKDLFVPFKEQKAKMKEGGNYLVFLYLDGQTDRLVATAKVEKYIEKETIELEEGQEVTVLICDETELGRKVIVENKYNGLIFKNRITKFIQPGDFTTAYVEKIREDGKIDLSLDKLGVEKFDEHTQQILDYLDKNNNRMFLTDKSDPDEIRMMLGMSKKSFKKALGNLYKLKKITLLPDRVELV